MTQTEMERLLENLDRRLTNVEQILPTLATKTDLERFATKADLERFATKADLEQYATKAGLADVKLHSQLLFESLHHDIRLIADGLAMLSVRVEDTAVGLQMLTARLERKGVI